MSGFLFLQADAASLPVGDASVDLVLTSPPYSDCRLYGELGYKLSGMKWVDWMVPRVLESCRVSRGLAVYVMAGPVRQQVYSPVVEWLVTDLTRECGVVCGPAPYCYHRSGVPGSGSHHYHRRNWEPCYAFAFPDRLPLPWSDNLATAAPPKYKRGGNFSNRKQNGQRTSGRAYPSELKLANVGNVLSVTVGGGHMGSELAHANEAPFAEALCDFFIRSYVPPGGVLLDPFSGSGTAVAAAVKAGRQGIGVDYRHDQAILGSFRLTGKTREEYRAWLSRHDLNVR